MEDHNRQQTHDSMVFVGWTYLAAAMAIGVAEWMGYEPRIVEVASYIIISECYRRAYAR
jgi:hypothetical protein